MSDKTMIEELERLSLILQKKSSDDRSDNNTKSASLHIGSKSYKQYKMDKLDISNLDQTQILDNKSTLSSHNKEKRLRIDSEAEKRDVKMNEMVTEDVKERIKLKQYKMIKKLNTLKKAKKKLFKRLNVDNLSKKQEKKLKKTVSIDIKKKSADVKVEPEDFFPGQKAFRRFL